MMMDAPSLVSAMSNFSAEEEFDDFLDEALPVQHLAKTLVSSIGDEVTFNVLHP